jgi:putative copper export protein
MDPESEVLSEAPVRLQRASEPAEPRLRTSRSGWWWLVALVLVVACAVAVVDSHSRDRESAAMGRCERALQLATWYTQGSLGLLTNYLRPAPVSGGRVQQLHLADLMSERAGSALPRVQRAARTCQAVEVHRWHFSIVERKSAAASYSAALVTLVQLVAAQGHVTFRDDQMLQQLGDAVGVNAG